MRILHSWAANLAAGKIGDSPNKSDTKLGAQTQLGAESQSKWTIQLVPKPWKMVIIIPRRWSETWKGVAVATRCSEWMCRIRGGLVLHTIIQGSCCVISPAVARCCSRSYTDNISKWLVLYQNLQYLALCAWQRWVNYAAGAIVKRWFWLMLLWLLRKK